MNVLATKGLSHNFSKLEVLFDVNLEVKEGERHAIIGPNGAGKTTLFNVITGTYVPSKEGSFLRERMLPDLHRTRWFGTVWGAPFRSPALLVNSLPFRISV